MIRSATLCAFAVATLAAGPAAAQSRVQAGVLECYGSGATSFIIGSVHELSCVFRSDFMPPQPYYGVVRRVGLDVGITERSALAWAVFAPAGHIGPGDIAGNYAGATAGAAVGVGGNANALVGGSNNSIALQPVSVEGQVGINVAVGIAGLELRYGR